MKKVQWKEVRKKLMNLKEVWRTPIINLIFFLKKINYKEPKRADSAS